MSILKIYVSTSLVDISFHKNDGQTMSDLFQVVAVTHTSTKGTSLMWGFITSAMLDIQPCSGSFWTRWPMGSFSGLPWKRPSTTPASDTAKRTENIQSLQVLKNFRLKLIYPNVICLNCKESADGFLLKWWTHFRQKRREMGSRT